MQKQDYYNDFFKLGNRKVTGIAWDQSRMTAVYQYDPYGQVTLGETDYVEFYGYNGESYNPNTWMQKPITWVKSSKTWHMKVLGKTCPEVAME